MSVTVDNYIDITIDLTDDQKRFYRWWVSALESGEYKQVRGTLRRSVNLSHHTSTGHCCLGVAAEGMRLEEFATIRADLGLAIADTRSGGLVIRYGVTDENLPLAEVDGVLPDAFERFLGFVHPGLNLVCGVLTAANDVYHLSFKAIARAIRLALVGKDREARSILDPVYAADQTDVNKHGGARDQHDSDED